MSKIRVLIIDDSASVRQAMTAILSADPQIEVIAAAADPFAAARYIQEEVPDVITLDVEMPRMDGITFLRKLMAQRPVPVVMCSSLVEEGSETLLQALEAGAVDVILKPRVGVADHLAEAHMMIRETVKGAATARLGARRQTRTASPAQKLTADAVLPPPTGRAMSRTTEMVVCIGASTGGTEALREILEALPANSPGIVIVQHMPATFTTSFAARLDRLSKPTVAEARHGQPLLPGHVYLAPGGTHHLEVGGTEGQYRARLIPDDPMSGHRPSVDRLFHSVAKNVGDKAVGAILTGMGRDGADGLLAMRRKGSFTVGQDQESCVVYGMPGVAQEVGAVTKQLTLTRVAPAIIERCRA